MVPFNQMEEEAKGKGYLLTKVDRGPRHRPMPKISDRHEIWLEGNREGPYTERDLPGNFLYRIGIGPTLEIALEEAQRDLEQRPSHASAFVRISNLEFEEDVREILKELGEILRSNKT